ncbi:DUF4115 domain-containing protein [Sphingomonas sp. ZT3P38]|uniref:helix-turn-helix domain-containing protein n=1 Tax=Parasphingomonas zepuensis TaxID=3096161 RepID=UPI002FC5C7CA
MTDTDPGEEATLFPKTAGERLREAREAQGLSLAEIAARTRIPVRQLEAIEASNYAALPSITYSVGFAKAYARAVGADEVAIARDVRSQNNVTARRTDYETYEVSEASRVPNRSVLLISSVLFVLLVIAGGLWYGTTWFRGEEVLVPAAIENVEEAQPEPTPAPATAGQVSLTATDEVWVRIYDAAGKTLYENTLKPGDRYDVPADADNPMINVGRPDKIQVMLNGSQVAPLGDGSRAIQDVGISAAALRARIDASAAPTPAATSATRRAAQRQPQAESTPTPGATDATPPAFAPAPAPTTTP